MKAGNSFTAAERAVFRRLTTPAKIQRFLDDLVYNKEPNGPTCRSPRRVLRDRTAHCMEGALFAAAALRQLGYPPLLFDLEAEPDLDDDHVLAVFRVRRHWGAIGKSNYSGLRFREPVYRDLRELAMSYLEHFYNPRGEKTLRAYSRPVHLGRFDRIEWMTAETEVWAIPERLCEIPHRRLMTAAQIRALNRMDKRLYDAGLLGSVGTAPQSVLAPKAPEADGQKDTQNLRPRRAFGARTGREARLTVTLKAPPTGEPREGAG